MASPPPLLSLSPFPYLLPQGDPSQEHLWKKDHFSPPPPWHSHRWFVLCMSQVLVGRFPLSLCQDKKRRYCRYDYLAGDVYYLKQHWIIGQFGCTAVMSFTPKEIVSLKNIVREVPLGSEPSIRNFEICNQCRSTWTFQTTSSHWSLTILPKTSENHRFSDHSREFRKRHVL